MDIKQLRYFVAIAEEGSLSAASARLHVAQPSLSQHVIKIEDELGVQLLDRSPRGVVLTQSGQILLKHARDICQSMEVCRQLVRESGGAPHGSVSIGLPSSVSMVLSVPLAETVLVELPKVRLRAIEAMSGFIKTWLEDQSIDLAFLYEVDELKNCHVHKLTTEDLHFFAGADNWPLATKPGSPVNLADLTGLDFILPSQHHGLRQRIERCAREIHVTLNVIIEMDSLQQIKELVTRGSGFTILAPAAAQDSIRRGELLSSRILDAHMTRPIYLVRNQLKPMTEACRAVESITVAVVKDLVKRKIWNATENLGNQGK